MTTWGIKKRIPQQEVILYLTAINHDIFEYVYFPIKLLKIIGKDENFYLM